MKNEKASFQSLNIKRARFLYLFVYFCFASLLNFTLKQGAVQSPFQAQRVLALGGTSGGIEI
ncbi:MAG: hypothetical protein J6K14_09815 [Clostridia bacterium]|nr:hypothetical protein [Clostridia bacterium]